MRPQVVQAHMRSGTTITTGWIDALPAVKVGAVLTLGGDDRQWEILSLGEPTDKADVLNLGHRVQDLR